jgi:hypothetical protein
VVERTIVTADIDVRIMRSAPGGQALHVLTVEFGNATLGSQASKHAEAFRRGQKMAAITDVASIVLEEVS